MQHEGSFHMGAQAGGDTKELLNKNTNKNGRPKVMNTLEVEMQKIEAAILREK